MAALGIGVAGFLTSTAPIAARQAIDLSDLAAQVIDAVVNISASKRPVTEGSSPNQSQRVGPSGNAQGPTVQRPNGQPNARQLLSSLGSGFVIDASGIIVTNEHVIRGAEEIGVILNNGTRLRAELIGQDSEIDVAVLRVRPDAPLPALKFADSDKIRVGEPVMAIGNPSGLGGTVTAGIVSAKNRDIGLGPFDNFIQTDASINRGNSGGPLFDMAGDVIGINTLGLSPSGGSIGLNFAVPANKAQPVISQIREFGEARRGSLGVHVQELSNEIAEALKLETTRGALVSGFEARSPAGLAGMHTGDVIVNVDGREVRGPRELPRILAAVPVGAAVPVMVMRDGRSSTLTVTIGLRESSAPASPGRQTRGSPVITVLGMQLSSMTPELRNQLQLRSDTRGLIVVAVNPASLASQRGIRPGTVITEVHNKEVNSPGEFVRRVETLKTEGRRSAVFLVHGANGQKRLIALDLT
jgi:serine protease Do